MSSLEGGIVETPEGCLVNVRVITRSRREGVFFERGEPVLKVAVRSPPAEGKANRDLLAVLKGFFGESEIKRGFKSRDKVVLIRNRSREDVLTRLGG